MKVSPVEIATFPLAPLVSKIRSRSAPIAEKRWGPWPRRWAQALAWSRSTPPYCWKVDGDGNQRSDIDLVVHEVVQDPQVLLLNALAGENDMIAALTDDYGNKAVLFAGMEQGGYRFIDKTPSASNHTNYTFKQIHQTAVLPSYELLHDEKLATQYLNYDVAQANEYLDKAFPEKNNDGFRLGPNGNRIQFALLTRADKTFMAVIGQMLVGYWRDLGVDTRFDVVDRSLVRFRKNANQHYDIIEYFPGGARGAFLRPTPWGPMHHNAV